MDIKFSADKKPVFTGVSGINQEDYIAYKMSNDKKKIGKLEKEIVVLDKVSLEYDNYVMKLAKLKTSSNALRGASEASQDYKENIFVRNKVSITSSDNKIPGESLIQINTNDYITPGVYKIKVVNLATAKRHIYSGFTSDKIDLVKSEPRFFSPGNFTINDKVVNIMPGDNLININTKINQLSPESKVVSRIIKKNSADYLLILSSKEVGTQNSFNINDQNNVLTQLELTVQDAQDARLYFDDVMIERSTNIIDDFSDDIKLKVMLILANTDVDLFISSRIDEEAVTKNIVDFVESFNEVQIFIHKQSERDTKNNTLKSSSILGNKSEFITSKSEILGLIRHQVVGNDALRFPNIESFGLEIKNYQGSAKEGDNSIDNALQSRDNKGEEVINNVKYYIDDVKKLFAFEYTSSSPNLIITHTTNDITKNNFVVDIDLNRPHVAVAEGMAQDKVRIIVDGQVYRPFFKDGQIIAPKDSPISGMKLYYRGQNVELINVSMTQGVADKFYNYLSWFLADSNYMISGNLVEDLSNGTRKYDSDGNIIYKSLKKYGGITLIKEAIKAEKTSKGSTLVNIQEVSDTKKDNLVKVYTQKEAQLSKLKAILKNSEDQFTAQYSKK